MPVIFLPLNIHIDLSPCYFCLIQEGVYVYVSNESRELTVINGAPPGYTSCDRVGRLSGCRFKFDEPDAQCSSGRSGRLSESPAYNLSSSLIVRYIPFMASLRATIRVPLPTIILHATIRASRVFSLVSPEYRSNQLLCPYVVPFISIVYIAYYKVQYSLCRIDYNYVIAL